MVRSTRRKIIGIGMENIMDFVKATEIFKKLVISCPLDRQVEFISTYKSVHPFDHLVLKITKADFGVSFKWNYFVQGYEYYIYSSDPSIDGFLLDAEQTPLNDFYCLIENLTGKSIEEITYNKLSYYDYTLEENEQFN